MDILSKIVEIKKTRLEVLKRSTPSSRVADQAMIFREAAPPHAFLKSINRTDRINVIAEFKRRSPSKGTIREGVAAAELARLYETGGAAAISVLTEEDHFGGSLEDLCSVKESVSLPVLRKDFIVDEYQVFESAAAGSDALLLIVAALDDESLLRLREIAEEQLKMDALVEVHSKQELKRASDCGAKLIGINNRDLKTFLVSLQTSIDLIQAAPRDATLVSESGLRTRSDLEGLKALGFKGFLIGESLMSANHPDAKLRELVGNQSS